MESWCMLCRTATHILIPWACLHMKVFSATPVSHQQTPHCFTPSAWRTAHLGESPSTPNNLINHSQYQKSQSQQHFSEFVHVPSNSTFYQPNIHHLQVTSTGSFCSNPFFGVNFNRRGTRVRALWGWEPHRFGWWRCTYRVHGKSLWKPII